MTVLIEIEKGGDGKSMALRVYRVYPHQPNVSPGSMELFAEEVFDHVPAGLTLDFDGSVAYLRLEDVGGF